MPSASRSIESRERLPTRRRFAQKGTFTSHGDFWELIISDPRILFDEVRDGAVSSDFNAGFASTAEGAPKDDSIGKKFSHAYSIYPIRGHG